MFIEDVSEVSEPVDHDGNRTLCGGERTVGFLHALLSVVFDYRFSDRRESWGVHDQKNGCLGFVPSQLLSRNYCGSELSLLLHVEKSPPQMCRPQHSLPRRLQAFSTSSLLVRQCQTVPIPREAMVRVPVQTSRESLRNPLNKRSALVDGGAAKIHHRVAEPKDCPETLIMSIHLKEINNMI